MPTIHVAPDAGHLQDISNHLFKARKVIVVTGAGISTNSGIPVSFLSTYYLTLITIDEIYTYIYIYIYNYI